MALSQSVSRLDAEITALRGILTEANSLIITAERGDSYAAPETVAALKLQQVQTTLALAAFEYGMAGVQEEDASPDALTEAIGNAVVVTLKKVKNHIKLTMPEGYEGSAWADAILTFLDAEIAARTHG